MAGVTTETLVVPVPLGERAYDILLGPLATTLPKVLAALSLTPKALLITDEKVAALYAAQVKQQLEACGFAVRLALTPVGEEAKSLAVAAQLYDEAAAAGLDRNSVVVALGGGVVGDVAGFIAATYMRGVQFIQIPTTLLAQVDASVGGKVAINHPAGKNLIGAFYQPRAVLADVHFLATLTDRDYHSGLAEVVKHALLDSEEKLSWLEKSLDALQRREETVLQQIVAWCCRYKAGVVVRDEREKHERKFLNLGHTFGHAVEAWGGFSRWTHGEAVAIGLVAALKLSEEKLDCPPMLRQRTCDLLAALGLPTTLPGDEDYDLQPFLLQDKKSEREHIDWVLVSAPGETQLFAVSKAETVCERLL